MKKKLLLATGMFLLLSSIFIYSCSKSSGYGSNPGGGNYPPPPPPNTVNIKSIAFSPSTLTVTAGTTVTWTNNDNMAHTVTADDNSWDSGNLAVGGTFSFKFNTAGTFNYHCNYHANMMAKVIVQ